jgi:hypothetical protein
MMLSAGVGIFSLMLIAGRMSGTSDSSSSSLDESESDKSDSSLAVTELSDEISDGWYSCLSGEEPRRLMRETPMSTGGDKTGGLFFSVR